MLTLKQFTETIDRLEEARVLMASLEFKIFSVLRQKSMTAREVARKSKTKPGEMEALLNALAAMKALRFVKGKYSSAPQMYKYFCESSPNYLKGTAFLKLEKNNEWARMIDIIRNGRDLSEFEEEDEPKFRDLFTYAMHERSEPFAGKIAEVMTRKPVGSFLDLGAGPGTYSAEILRKDKKAQATLLDRTAALKVARKLHGKAAIWKRMNCIEGDLFDSEYGENYDTVFYSNILHIYDSSQNWKIFQKIHKSMVQGGRLFLVDYFHHRDGTKPYEAALFGVTMLMFTATGKTYSYYETTRMLEAAGFHKFQRIDLEEGTGILLTHKR